MKSTFLFFCLFSVGASASGDRGYVVKDVSGLVLAWLPFHSHWFYVGPETTLPEGTLLQLMKGGEITFSREGSSQLTLRESQIIRMQESSFKKFQISPNFSPQATKIWEESPLELAQRILKSAWKRIVAGKTQFEESSKKELPEVPNADIEILAPARDSTYFADSLPFNIPVFWRGGADQAEYEIHLRKPGEEKLTIVERTKELFCNLKWEESGEFHIQVATRDGKHRSKFQRVYLALSVSAKRSLASGEAAKKPVLTLPPENFTYLISQFPVDIVFQWEGNNEQELFLTSTWNKTRKVEVRGSIAQVLFTEPGEYSWRVGASDSRRLTLQESKQPGLALPIAKWLEGAAGVVFVGSDGM